MTLIPEQLSAASKSPFEAQLDFVRALTTQAFKSAEQVVTLNLNTSRVSVERSSTAVRQLLSATDPRDLLLLTSHTQQQFQTLVNYSRALFNIAASARLDLPYQRAAEVSAPPAQPEAAAPADAATAPGWPSRAAQAAPAAPEASATAAPAAPVAAAAPAQPAVQAAFSPATPEPEPSAAGVAAANVVETLVEATEQNLAAAMPEALPQAIAQATPLAQAISQVTAQSPVAEHPLASPLPDTAAHEIEIASIRPVEATAPASRAAAIEGKRTGTTGAKGTRRK